MSWSSRQTGSQLIENYLHLIRVAGLKHYFDIDDDGHRLSRNADGLVLNSKKFTRDTSNAKFTCIWSTDVHSHESSTNRTCKLHELG